MPQQRKYEGATAQERAAARARAYRERKAAAGKQRLVVDVPIELLERMDAVIGTDGNRSDFVTAAIREKLARGE